MNPRLLLVAFAVVTIAVLGVVGLFAAQMSVMSDPRGTSPEEAYRELIVDPIPAAVSDLQGGGTHFRGYSISLRLRAPSLESAGFTQPPYVQADCSHVYSYLMAKRLDPSPFSPRWEIPEAENPICLEWNELSNDWTRFGNHSVLFVDGWIFFVGSGG